MKRILSTLAKKWPKYLLEILVIIVGIYGAFALDNWNEERKERNLELKYLKSILTEIKEDVESLTFMNEYRETSSKTAVELLNLETVETSFEAQLKFTKDLMTIIFWWEFTPNDNTFRELTSSGNLVILKNEKIKNGLLNLEALNREIIKNRDHMRRDYDEYIYDQLFQHEQFEFIDYKTLLESREVTYVKDIDNDQLEQLINTNTEILTNTLIRNGLKLIILNNSYMLEIYDQMTAQLEALEKEIITELNQQ